MFTALLDTCVLWPSLQRDFLLALAAEGMYRPIWSSLNLQELEYEEAWKRIDRGTPKNEAHRCALRLVDQMRQTFDDAESRVGKVSKELTAFPTPTMSTS